MSWKNIVKWIIIVVVVVGIVWGLFFGGVDLFDGGLERQECLQACQETYPDPADSASLSECEIACVGAKP